VADGPAVPPPGWHPGPNGSGDQRWWNGDRWTERTRPPTLASDWRAWFARSPQAERVGRVIATAAPLCAAGAFAVGLAALVRDKPTPGLTILLLPAIPTVFVGQLWMIAALYARLPRSTGSWRERVRARRAVGWNWRIVFGGLPATLLLPLLGLAFVGWLSAMTAFPSIANGGPAGAGDGCRYRLDSHARYTCVSRATYEDAGAGEQRFASGIFLAFFAVHTCGALGELHRRRQRD